MRPGLIKKCIAACLALSLAGAAAADAATTRSFKGKTSQKKTITFRITGKKLKRLKFSINLTCSDGSTLTDAESGFETIKIGKSGKISDTQVGKTDTVVTTARLRRGKVTGTLKVTDKLSSTVSCGPQTVKFSAKRVR
jgi:hypothetical protein